MGYPENVRKINGPLLELKFVSRIVFENILFVKVQRNCSDFGKT